MLPAIIGGALSLYSIGKGIYDKKRAKAEMNNYERAELQNAFKNIQVSTMDTDIMREEAMRNTANMISASQQGGMRGVVSSMPSIQNYINSNNKQIQSILDGRLRNREMAIAQDEQRLREIRENRDLQNLSAISSRYQSGEQSIANGITGAIASAGSLSRSKKQNDNNGKTNKTDNINTESNNIEQNAVNNNITTPQANKVNNNGYTLQNPHIGLPIISYPTLLENNTMPDNNYFKPYNLFTTNGLHNSSLPNYGLNFMNKNIFE